jgi:hypothetical protein
MCCSSEFVCAKATVFTYKVSGHFWNLSAYTITSTNANNKTKVIENFK